MSCDVTWLSHLPSNPLSVGQMVNNHTHGTHIHYVLLHVLYEVVCYCARNTYAVYTYTHHNTHRECRHTASTYIESSLRIHIALLKGL